MQSSQCTLSKADQVQAATHDSDYWSDYGDLILVSQGVAFRIPKSPLAEHSAVFQSMFAQATPAAGDLVDGCTAIVLDDFPKDWRELFGLIYPLSTNIELGRRKVEMALISAIVRLGYKYDMKELYDQAMGYLTAYYTTSFDTWADGRHAARWQPDPIHAITSPGSPTPSPSSPPPSTSARHSATATSREAVPHRHEHDDLFNAPGGQGLVWPRKGCCAEVWSKLLWHTGDANAPHRVSSKRALDSWVENTDSLQAAVPARGLGVMLLQHVYGLGWLFDSPRALCEGCRDHLRRRDRELRKEVWGTLPKLLGLTIEGWDAT